MLQTNACFGYIPKLVVASHPTLLCPLVRQNIFGTTFAARNKTSYTYRLAYLSHGKDIFFSSVNVIFIYIYWGVLWPVYLFHSPPYLELYINFQELYLNSQELYTDSQELYINSQELYINSQEIYLESQEFQGLCIRYQHVCCMISDDFTNLVDLNATLLRRKLGNINFSSKVLAKLAGQSFFFPMCCSKPSAENCPKAPHL